MTEEAKRCINALERNIQMGFPLVGDMVEAAYARTIINLIESLSVQLDQVTRELDAAVKGLARYRRCIDCDRYDEEVVKTSTLCDDCSFGSKWQWRGVVEVEG